MRNSLGYGQDPQCDANAAPTENTDQDPKRFDVKSDEWAEDLLSKHDRTRDPIKYNISLWRKDTAMALLDFLQTYGLLLLVAADQRAWPLDWFKGTYFAMAFNVDVLGMFTHRDYSRDAAQPIPTAKIKFNYLAYYWCWLAVPALIAGLYFWVAYKIKNSDKPKVVRRMLKLKMTTLFLAQALYLPVGLVLARSFHCVPGQIVEADVAYNTLVSTVNNEWECFSSMHLGTFVPSLLLFIVGMPFLTHLLYKHVLTRVFHSDTAHHEVYVRLKEMEFVQNTDYTWGDGGFFVFASYRLPFVQKKAITMALKSAMLVGFAIGPHYSENALNAHICIIAIAIFAEFVMAMYTPYRVRTSNVVNLCLTSANLVNVTLLLMHVFRENYQNQLLTDDILPNLLLAVNAAFFSTAIIVIFQAELRQCSFAQGRSIWPPLFDPESTADQTVDFARDLNLGKAAATRFSEQLRIIAAGRRIVADCTLAPPLLAPVHDVVRCLLIANAAARRTQVNKDPLHYAIWDLVDELVDIQNSLADKSIFGMAQKETSKETAQMLLAEIPQFSKRLQNREFYLCLVSKKRRRILLKLFCMATFMANARKKKF